jgi:transcriptional regulator with AbiEi antitoxin domain of type IV toxin-antitoxin system
MGTKINRLLQALPFGGVATQAWLTRHDVDARLADKYVRSGWLVRVGRGAFARAGQPVDWPGALWALQQSYPVAPAGPSVLELRGFSHNLALGSAPALVLFGPPQTKLPAWFRGGPWTREVRYYTPNLFANDPVEQDAVMASGHLINLPPLERAALELMWLVPKHHALPEALQLLETLNILRPAIMQAYLQECRSVKAKRLLLYAAERLALAWVTDIDVTQVDLGTGPRSIDPGGRLNTKYNLVVNETDAY